VSGDVLDVTWANLHIVGRSGKDLYIGWLPYVDLQGWYYSAPALPYEITLSRQSGTDSPPGIPPGLISEQAPGPLR
jgi:hypothetical protein